MAEAKVPAKHLVQVALPAVAALPMGQAVHEVFDSLLCVPGAQVEHVPVVESKYWPGRQLHVVDAQALTLFENPVGSGHVKLLPWPKSESDSEQMSSWVALRRESGMPPVSLLLSAIRAMSLLLSATSGGIEPVSRLEATLTITAPVISSTGILQGARSQKLVANACDDRRTFRSNGCRSGTPSCLRQRSPRESWV